MSDQSRAAQKRRAETVHTELHDECNTRMREAPAFRAHKDDFDIKHVRYVPPASDYTAPWAGEYFCTKDNAYLRLEPHADPVAVERLGAAFVKEHRGCR